MALRVFADDKGRAWQVWDVQASAGARGVREDLRGGWLCFELVNGGERCRLPWPEVPPGWEQLPEDRLEMLRRQASTEQPSHRAQRLTGEHAVIEDDEAARKRPSGPRQALGPDDRL
jgi:hypothetical protein